MSAPVLRVEGLVTSFPVGRGARAAVVDGVTLELGAGEVLALVGESGCGKTLTALSLLRLVPRPGQIDAGSVLLAGRDVLGLGVAEVRQLRGREAAMIFQEPMTSLNPVQTVGHQVMEAIRLHQRVSHALFQLNPLLWFHVKGYPKMVSRPSWQAPAPIRRIVHRNADRPRRPQTRGQIGSRGYN